MKTLLTIFTLLFTVMFSSASFANWTKVGENVSGDTMYVDLERIRKHGGFVYYWSLTDYLKPDKWGDLSNKIYYQADCNLFRVMTLSYAFHKLPMGDGTGEIDEPVEKEKWTYPTPDSMDEILLKEVCG